MLAESEPLYACSAHQPLARIPLTYFKIRFIFCSMIFKIYLASTAHARAFVVVLVSEHLADPSYVMPCLPFALSGKKAIIISSSFALFV
jgi:hypothetical protein